MPQIDLKDYCHDFDYGKCKRGFKCSPTCELFTSKYIRLIVSGEGDRSVGIQGENTEVLIERRFTEGDYAGNRKWIKKDIINIFSELFDDVHTHATFEDECYGCGKLKTECKCPDDT